MEKRENTIHYIFRFSRDVYKLVDKIHFSLISN